MDKKTPVGLLKEKTRDLEDLRRALQVINPVLILKCTYIFIL